VVASSRSTPHDRRQVTGNRRAAAIGRRAAEALLARELPPGLC
jgi:hypothetical protein